MSTSHCTCAEHVACEREARLQDYLANDRTRGFDLAEGPVMRLALFRFADNEQVLVWSFHHIILGGGSLGVGYDFPQSYAILAYSFRTLGLRFTF